MDTSGLTSLIEQLDEEIDDLEESVSSIVNMALSETASKLPLLDKAKLYVLVTYAIESILFSYLRLNGVKARDHPVFIELTRVKQYFDKVKVAENPVGPRETVLDTAAAARFIKAGLSGNDKHDLEVAERKAKERARAHIRFDQGQKAPTPSESSSKPVSTEVSESSSSASSEIKEKKASKKHKKRKAQSAESSEGMPAPPSKKKRKRKDVDGKSAAKESKKTKG